MKRCYRIPELELLRTCAKDLCTASIGFAEQGYGDEIDFSDLT